MLARARAQRGRAIDAAAAGRPGRELRRRGGATGAAPEARTGGPHAVAGPDGGPDGRAPGSAAGRRCGQRDAGAGGGGAA